MPDFLLSCRSRPLCSSPRHNTERERTCRSITWTSWTQRWLEGLAGILDKLPPLEDWEMAERSDVARACRQAAQLAAAHSTGEQSYEAAKSYAGGEWHNAVLRSLVGAKGAQQLLTDHYTRTRS